MMKTDNPLNVALPAPVVSRVALALALAFTLSLPSFAQIKRRDDAPQPLTPEKSLDSFRLPDGLRIELVAAEPLVEDPVTMTFDSQGRIFVGEIHGYNVDGHIDITELNKTGKLDKEVRRILADDDTLKRAEELTFGVVKLLEDTDGDGRMDKVTVWDDKLPACFGVVPARDGVIVLCAPSIIYLGDTDHDGKPDVREVIFTGFGAGELWSRINTPLRGIDNWIYAGTGIGAEGTITGPNLSEPVELGFTSFRFKTDGSAIEPVTGAAHGFGQTMNAWGDRFLCTNQEHAVMSAALPYRYLMRNPHVATPKPELNISSYGHPAKLYPISRPHPWRTERHSNPEWVEFYGPNETSSGLVTSACGPLVYEADGLPEDFEGDHFSCEPSQNLIHHCKILRDGLRYSVQRPENEQEIEFLASTETWFRPVHLSIGPDGALYIVDMYREIIEDYSAIPRYLQQQYGLIEGHKRGRIYRVVSDSPAKEATEPKVDSESVEHWVEQLNSENRWRRQTAQQQLIERQDKSAVEPLIQLARHGERFTTRFHALHTLAGLESLTPEIVGVALQDKHFSVRVQALQLVEPWLETESALFEETVAMVDDPEPRVRLQLAMTLGESQDPSRLPTLAAIAASDGGDPWMRAAILSSVPDSAGELLDLLITQGQASSEPPSIDQNVDSQEADDKESASQDSDDKGSGGDGSLIESLAIVVGTQGDADSISSLLVSLGAVREQPTTAISMLSGLASGIKRGELSGKLPKEGAEMLISLMTRGSSEARNLAFEIARSAGLSDTDEIKSIFANAASEASDSELSLESRQGALKLLSNAPFSTLAVVARDVLKSSQAPELQITAIESLSISSDEAVMDVLLENWSRYTPTVRTATIKAIFSRKDRLPGLLDAIEQKKIATHEIDALQRTQLLKSYDESIRDRAKTLLTESDTDAGDELIARYIAALELPRDFQRGEVVFKESCAKCHRLNDVGQTVGPDLAAAKGRADETLLLDILRPSRAITVGYQSHTVLTLDGLFVSGILKSETATSITVQTGEGVDVDILRADIDEMQVARISLMPEGLEKEISPQDAANLIGFLRKSLSPDEPQSEAGH